MLPILVALTDNAERPGRISQDETIAILTELMASMKISPDVSIERIARENSLWATPTFPARICARMQQVCQERIAKLRASLKEEGKSESEIAALAPEIISKDDVEWALCWEASLY